MLEYIFKDPRELSPSSFLLKTYLLIRAQLKSYLSVVSSYEIATFLSPLSELLIVYLRQQLKVVLSKVCVSRL